MLWLEGGMEQATDKVFGYITTGYNLNRCLKGLGLSYSIASYLMNI